jgi:hypothetical protein
MTAAARASIPCSARDCVQGLAERFYNQRLQLRNANTTVMAI